MTNPIDYDSGYRSLNYDKPAPVACEADVEIRRAQGTGAMLGKPPGGLFIRTPEAIREDIDARREADELRQRIPASNPAPRPEEPKAVRTKRPITVTVSGERLSGKTTLISIVSQALRNSDHIVTVPRGTPNASFAVADLHEQFDITFVEQDAASLGAIPHVFQEREDRLRAQLQKMSEDNVRQANYIATLEETQRLHIENANTAWAKVGELQSNSTTDLKIAVDTSAIQPAVDAAVEIAADNERLTRLNEALRTSLAEKAEIMSTLEDEIVALKRAAEFGREKLNEFRHALTERSREKAEREDTIECLDEQLKELQAKVQALQTANRNAFDQFRIERDRILKAQQSVDNSAEVTAQMDMLSAHLTQALEEIERLKAEATAVDHDQTASGSALEEAHNEIASLKRRLMPQAQAEHEIEAAFEEYRQAIVLDVERQRLLSSIEDLQSRRRKIGSEVDARKDKSRARLLTVLTGEASKVRQETPVDRLERANQQFFAAAEKGSAFAGADRIAAATEKLNTANAEFADSAE